MIWNVHLHSLAIAQSAPNWLGLFRIQITFEYIGSIPTPCARQQFTAWNCCWMKEITMKNGILPSKHDQNGWISAINWTIQKSKATKRKIASSKLSIYGWKSAHLQSVHFIIDPKVTWICRLYLLLITCWKKRCSVNLVLKLSTWTKINNFTQKSFLHDDGGGHDRFLCKPYAFWLSNATILY